MAVTAIGGFAMAQERRVPTAAELRLSYAPVVQRVAPAVVNVYAAKLVQNRNPLLDDPIFRRFFGVPGGGARRSSQVQRSLGSGVIVDAYGLIVTNNHVVEGADEVKVSLADKREFEASSCSRMSATDLAVLHIKDGSERLPYLNFANSDALEVGDVVLAIGNPFGVGQTVTHGIVVGAGAHAGRHHRLSVLHSDRRGHQSGQFRRRAGGPDRTAGRHQHRDLLALGRLTGHRLRHPRQHGAAWWWPPPRVAAAR